MPRGLSIVPRQSGRNKGEVPEELKSSFFGSTLGAFGQSDKAVPHISVFDDEGNITTHQVGVHTFRFRRSALFYYVRSLNWITLFSLSISIYLLIVGTVSVMYYIWGNACGAGDTVNVIGAIYFTVVSLAANGGYLGEDDDTMANPNDFCYRGRTVIVMICSYVNIIFVGVVAALVVSKAESTSKLGNRIVFSTFCALSPVPGRPDQWKLTFRIANVENTKPLANGKLRLFCLSTQPMSEYKREQREQRKLLHYMRRARKAASSADLTGPGSAAVAEKLTNELLRRKRVAQTELSGSGGRAAAAAAIEAAGSPDADGAGAGLTNASFGAQDPMVKTLLEYKRRKSREAAAVVREKRRGRKGDEKKGSPSPGQRGRRGDPPLSGRRPHEHSTDSTTAVVVGVVEGAGAEAQVTRTESKDSQRARSSSVGSTSSTSSTSASDATSSSDGDVKSDRTNSSVSDRQVFSPVSASPNNAGYGTIPHKQSSASVATSARRGKGFFHFGHNNDDEQEWEDVLDRDEDAWERVFITSQELSWVSAGESYLDHGASGQLGLWYPTAITHHIDERSPLFRFMDVQRVGVGLLQEMVFGAGVAAEVRKQQAEIQESKSGAFTPVPDNRPVGLAKRFQLVAVFDATEIETGATITAKHTYDTSEIVANSKFSNKLIRMHKKTREVWLDYHYFNDVLPLLATDSSTTDSES